MITEKIRNTIQKRKITDDEWYEAIEVCWNEEVSILSENIVETVKFIDTNCNEEEFVYISEVFLDLIEKTGSREILESYKKASLRFQSATNQYFINEIIKDAEFSLQGGNNGKD